MSKVLVTKQLLDDLNDSISSATGTIKNRTITQMTEDIPTGGSGGGLVQKSANFYDYDGTLVASYSVSEVNNMIELPTNPSHQGLVAQGWNWTLQEIKDYLGDYPEAVITIGQMYVTASGMTDIDVEFDYQDNLSPYLVLRYKGTIEIDWGDGSNIETITSASVVVTSYTQHIYSSIGKYTIKINVISGDFSFAGSSGGTGVLNFDKGIISNKIYSKNVKKIRLGTGTTAIYKGAFTACHNLESITMPNTLATFSNDCFSQCHNISFITIPRGVKSIGGYGFNECFQLKNIAIPASLTSFSSNCFNRNYSLENIIIPIGTTSLGSSIFSSCFQLKNIIIPNTVQELNTTFSQCNALREIKFSNNIPNFVGSLFYACYALTSDIIIPSGTTYVPYNAFYYCSSLKKIIFATPSTIKGIGSGAFYNCTSLREMQIPSGTTAISNQAFISCISMQKIIIPGTVSTIGNQVFQGCYNMQEYHFQSTVPPSVGSTNTFNNIGTATTIFVPSASVEDYKAAKIWSSFADHIYGE